MQNGLTYLQSLKFQSEPLVIFINTKKAIIISFYAHFPFWIQNFLEVFDRTKFYTHSTRHAKKVRIIAITSESIPEIPGEF